MAHERPIRQNEGTYHDILLHIQNRKILFIHKCTEVFLCQKSFHNTLLLSITSYLYHKRKKYNGYNRIQIGKLLSPNKEIDFVGGYLFRTIINC